MSEHEHDRQQLAQLVARYENAFNTNDADAMNSLFAEDATWVNFNGVVVAGKAALHDAQARVFARGGPLEGIAVRYSVEDIGFIASDIAVVRARQRTRGGPGELADGSGDPMHAVLTMIVGRAGDGWRIRTGQNTPVTVPAAVSSADGVTELVAELEAAFNTHDAAAMNALFTDDALWVNPLGYVTHGAPALLEMQRTMLEGPLRDRHARYAVVWTLFPAADVAVAQVRQQPTAADGAALPDEPESTALLVLARRGGGWLIAAGQNTLVR